MSISNADAHLEGQDTVSQVTITESRPRFYGTYADMFIGDLCGELVSTSGMLNFKKIDIYVNN